MYLTNLQVENYRCIVNSGEIWVGRLQAFVGENNSGKSNLLDAVRVFLTPGVGGVTEADFFDPSRPIVITATFKQLTKPERKGLRPYLRGDELALAKYITLEGDRRSGKIKPTSEYHGYKAEPKDWWLSTDGVIEHEGTRRPDWEKVAIECGIIDYVRSTAGTVNKSSYEAGLCEVLDEMGEDIEYQEPQLGETEALGLQPNLLRMLPAFHLLPAITDYSSEVSRRSSGTFFNQLMGDLADRILKTDPRYQEIEASVESLTFLLNAPQEGEQRALDQQRLAVLESTEAKLQELMARLMPSVQGVRMRVDVGEVKELFSRGVSMEVDDGRLTGVEMKGHGLQRCVVFGLLQAMILSQRRQLLQASTSSQAEDLPEGGEDREEEHRTIILAIEEPELYIHPQAQRLVFRVLSDFSGSDQVLYSTHSPAFVDVGNYETIAVVRKDKIDEGTKICQCRAEALDGETERETFQFQASFGLEQNQMFFAKTVILVEGAEDRIAILATARDIGIFDEFPEELGYSIVETGSKEEMPKFIKLLKGFDIPYMVLHELDGKPNSDTNKAIRALAEERRTVVVPGRLEDLVGHKGHFAKVYYAMKFFGDPNNITDELRDVVRRLFS